MESDKPKEVPKGVWIFWGAIGFLIIVRLIPWPNDMNNALTFVLNAITALGTLGAAIFAFLTVRQARIERIEDRSNRRPYFSFVEGELGESAFEEEDWGKTDYITLICKQIGTNPAADVSAKVAILKDVDNGFIDPVILDHREVNDIAANFNLKVNQGGFSLFNHGYHYVIVKLKYKDAIYSTELTQTIYLAWPGLSPDDINNPLYPMTPQAKHLALVLLKQAVDNSPRQIW
jgi:hypothetical protein